MSCQHSKIRAIYEQRPPSEGRKLQRIGSRCESCGDLTPWPPSASEGGTIERGPDGSLHHNKGGKSSPIEDKVNP